MKISNNLIGILNFLTLILSIPILLTGIWLHKQATSECERFLEKPIIILGVFLLIVSLMGFIGGCCRVTWLLWFYLFFMFLLIVVLFVFTIFAFVVTNKGAGESLSNKGYKEYRLGDYSNWLQKRVNDNGNWNRIKSCLQSGKLCIDFHSQFLNDTADKFYLQHLNALQSGCCKPSNDCGFTYQNPTNWTMPAGGTYTNPDCDTWTNDPKVLCFNCKSCKAGLLDNLKTNWKKVAVVNIIFLIFLIIVYSIGCCAFRNNRRDGWKRY
ncbi:putative tetraspanin/Peripherin [Medicago truncatula]|uniref:Putative tetraspanin/Peripherin n=1 Tax=Medicago truncatula TaxID=3880 RepID=A0A072V357_MEDTR|nr:tetraspanin-8 [Medicago truncatula]KEH32585.1 tetraspanin family protein [Medicago truncatula]RHN64821.1 putative tetraspanin/Peripherin [Medicago truncatula]